MISKHTIFIIGACLLSGCAKSQVSNYNDRIFEKHSISLGKIEQPTILPFDFEFQQSKGFIVLFKDNPAAAARLKTISEKDGRWSVSDSKKLTASCSFFDVVTIKHSAELLCLEGKKGIAKIDINTGTVEPLINIDFRFTPREKTFVHHVDISKDINGDGLDDLVIPGFDGFQISIQLKNGTFTPFRIIGPKEPFLDSSSIQDQRTYRHMGFTEDTIPWYLSRVHQFDYNADGLVDLVFWNQGQFDIYRQQTDGRFAHDPVSLKVNIPFDSDGLYSTLFSYPDEGTSGLIFGLKSTTKITYLHSFQDVNADSIPDMITHSLEGRGLTKQQSQYYFYFGEQTNTGVRFNEHRGKRLKPNFVGNAMHVGGYSTDLFQDFNNDGVTDIMLRHVNMQVSKMFRLMFTQTIALDLDFYSLDNDLLELDQTTATKSNHTDIQKYTNHIRPDYKLFDGKDGIFFPVTLIGDINGDNQSDLLIGYSDKELRIYYGTDGPELFESKFHAFGVDFSNNELLTSMIDINNDSKQDLFIQPHASDPAKVLTILISR
jgi:hypothetical protein